MYFVVTTPHFTHHPQDQVIELITNNNTFSFYCEAEGALSYYWRRQYGGIPSDTIGVNTNTLTFINIQPSHAGDYQCVATNASGNSYSNNATLTVNG